MPTLTKLYSMQEASQHNTKDDCWIVVDGKVYDVSAYMDEHPGGDDVILATTGKDATDDFEDAGHSKDARELMETMCIGELDTDAETSASASAEHDNQSIGYPQKLMTMTNQYWAVPAAVMGISVVVAVLYLRRK